MHVIALFLFSILPASFLALSTTAKILWISGFVYAVIQVLKQAPVLQPYLQGWLAILFNVIFAGAGVLATVPAEQLWSVSTFIAFLTAVLAAAGIHGTTSKLAARTATDNAGNKVGVAKAAAPKGALARFFVK